MSSAPDDRRERRMDARPVENPALLISHRPCVTLALRLFRRLFPKK
jgi:hypothetical protein